MSAEKTAVAIVGGGLAGLSAAMFLAWQNVPCILLEKHSKASLHPRAVGYTPRSMEIFNAVGIAEKIPQVPKGFRLRRVKVESLTGQWEEEAMPWKPNSNAGDGPEKAPEYTPFVGAALAQDRLEPIIREKARSLGADIRMGARMADVKQDASGVDVSVTIEDGKQHNIRASFVVAADGHRSQVRELLKITSTGRGYLSTVPSVLFNASLSQYQKDSHQFVVRQPGLEAFLTTYGDDRWVLMFTDAIERSEEEQQQAIRDAVGKQDLEFQIIATGKWEVKGVIADTFQNGRIFLAGDAAHTLPPTRGGYGANTGIQDAHNLAWKLAAVVSGICDIKLLETYSQERQPVAWLRHQQTFARPDYARYRQLSDDEVELYEDNAIELGQIYCSACIFDDEKDSPVEPLARTPDQWNGRPGTRAPHSWLKNKSGQSTSSLDIFQRDWVLLTEDSRWQEVNEDARKSHPLNVQCVVLNRDGELSDDGEYCRSLGLSTGGASLIRPDGYIAWRSKEWPPEPERIFSNVIYAIVSKQD